MNKDQMAQFSALIKQQTGKSIEDIDDIDAFFDRLKFTLNNENEMAHALKSLSANEADAVMLWCKSYQSDDIYRLTGLTQSAVTETVTNVRQCFFNKHFNKFTVGWTLNACGEPASPNPPNPTDAKTAMIRFDSWMIALGIDKEQR